MLQGKVVSVRATIMSIMGISFTIEYMIGENRCQYLRAMQQSKFNAPEMVDIIIAKTKNDYESVYKITQGANNFYFKICAEIAIPCLKMLEQYLNYTGQIIENANSLEKKLDVTLRLIKSDSILRIVEPMYMEHDIRYLCKSLRNKANEIEHILIKEKDSFGVAFNY